MPKIFIIGHGCHLTTNVVRNPNIKYYFYTNFNSCARGDATNPVFNEKQYRKESKRKNEYSISFTDSEVSVPEDTIDFNSMGVYLKRDDGTLDRITYFNNKRNKTLSDIIQYLIEEKYFTKNTQNINVYCFVCRTKCSSDSLSRSRSRSRSMSSSGKWSSSMLGGKRTRRGKRIIN